MFKNLLDKGKCSLGFHEGEWAYQDPGQCEQLRVCLRCQTENHRTEHTWGEWDYVTGDACDLARSCARCDESESRVEHSWGEAEYHDEGSCDQVHLCQRCGETKPAGTEHQWDSWAYLADDDCTQVQLCGRCGETSQQTQLNHDWGAWQQDDFYGVPLRVCRHCGELVFDLSPGVGQGSSPGVSLQEMDNLIEELLAADTIEDLYKRVQANQTRLVSPVRELYFRFAFDQYGHNDDLREALENMQGLLNLCEQYGIEATFAQLTGADQATQAPAEAPGSAAPAVPVAPAAGSGQGQVDPRLAGRYRHTDSQYSDGFSMATDTHMLLDSNGRFSWSSETAGSFGSSQSGPEYGSWFVANNQLCLNFDSGSQMVQAFELSADSLFLPQEGHYRLWTRY